MGILVLYFPEELWTRFLYIIFVFASSFEWWKPFFAILFLTWVIRGGSLFQLNVDRLYLLAEGSVQTNHLHHTDRHYLMYVLAKYNADWWSICCQPLCSSLVVVTQHTLRHCFNSFINHVSFNTNAMQLPTHHSLVAISSFSSSACPCTCTCICTGLHHTKSGCPCWWIVMLRLSSPLHLQAIVVFEELLLVLEGSGICL